MAADNPRGHRQQVAKALMLCPQCRAGTCIKCPDRLLLILGKNTVCSCTKSDHQEIVSGEPRRAQVQDPFTGDIHGPGAVISSETGVVKYTKGPNQDSA